MQDAFTSLEASRKNLWTMIKLLSEEEINRVPIGWNNNIIWNYGHVIVTQQQLCYGLSGTEMLIEKDLLNKYRKGTKPKGEVSLEEAKELKNLSIRLVQQTREDYKVEKFGEYKPYMTSFGVELTSIEQAIHFNNIHEGLHLGYCMALVRALS